MADRIDNCLADRIARELRLCRRRGGFTIVRTNGKVNPPHHEVNRLVNELEDRAVIRMKRR